MSFLGRKYRTRGIAGLLLLAYGSVGVLGYGLHAVWDCEHHCHEHAHADGIVHTHCDHHDHDGPVIASNECGSDALPSACADECPICEFLVQAQSPLTARLTLACVGTADIAYVFGETSYIAPLLGTHPARGPPLG